MLSYNWDLIPPSLRVNYVFDIQPTNLCAAYRAFQLDRTWPSYRELQQFRRKGIPREDKMEESEITAKVTIILHKRNGKFPIMASSSYKASI